jgi:intein/homing endonuclease
LLERLKGEIESNLNSALVHQIEEIKSELSKYDLTSLIEECNEYRRRIGFSVFPQDAEAYLADLLDIYKSHREKAMQEEAATAETAIDKGAPLGGMFEHSERGQRNRALLGR